MPVKGLKCVPALLLFGSAYASDPQAVAPPAAPLLPETNVCTDSAGPVAIGSVQWNGWGRDLDNTRYQPEPAIRATDVPKLALKWAYGFQGGTQFGQPTVVDGRLFITSSAGRVYSLDARTGCTYWTYDAAASGRTAVAIGELGQATRTVVPRQKGRRQKRTLAHLEMIKAPSAAFFGDDAGAIYALDAQRGTLLWKTQVETHPLARIRGAPIVYNDRLYVAVSSAEQKAASDPSYGCCTFRGSLAALDMASGRIVWKTYTVLDEPRPTLKSATGVQEFGPAGAAIAASPTIDVKRSVVYVSTGASTTQLEQSLTDAVAAFDLGDGKLRWTKQLTVPGEIALSGFTSSPLLRTLATGNQIILAGQESGKVYALDPDHGGAILWQTQVDGAGGVAWGMAADYKNLYVAHSGLLAQPATLSGQLTALGLKTGTLRWNVVAPQPACAWGDTNCTHAQSQAVSVMPGSAFSGSMDGHLRAYSTIDGKILWDFDTAKSYQTKNGVPAKGGPLDFGGATIVNGTLYIISGNSLLAFSVDGK